MDEKQIIGVVGGMGPLASAEFVRRVYHNYSFGLSEQSAPFIIQYSDPSVPDRTTSFLKKDFEPVYKRLVEILNDLDQVGANVFIICCFTIHYIVPRLPKYFNDRIISLVEVALNEVALTSDEKFLFLSTIGTRKMKILERHPQWHQVTDQIYFLSDADQNRVHQFIYEHLKVGVCPSIIADELVAIVNKYNVQGIIAGCTEIHLLTKEDQNVFQSFKIIDPLDLIARKLPKYLSAKITTKQ